MTALASLRALMVSHSLDAYLVPSEDSHGSEYISETDKRRAWISGFTGSAGTALITRDQAHLFTDGRYHQQAAKELSSEWTLQRHGLPDVKNWQEYLLSLPPSSRVGLDPTLLSISDYTTLLPTLVPQSIVLVPTTENLVDTAWGGEKPKRPAERVFIQEEKYAGESMKSKLGKVREECRKKKAWGIVASQLDEVAWMLNLRGGDIAFNPVFYASLVVPVVGHPTLFINIDQLPQDVYDYLMKNQILIEPYESIEEYLRTVGKGLKDGEVVIVPTKTNLALASAIGLTKIDVSRGPVGDLKAIKNAVEMEGFRQAHLRDGIALTRYFSWLERQLDAGILVTESSGADYLESLRRELPLFKGLSFPTISSTGAHASIIHYSPDPINSSPILRSQIYLCDSGAHYSDSTTDTTRTMHFGTPSEEEVRAYTCVLQGHIALDSMVFPKGTTGYLLDAFARKALWEEGLDYRHGTGHGVGSFLNVHEGPHAIGTRISHNDVKLQAGMSVSNEPGCYIDGKYGIRIENIILCKEAVTRNNFGNTGFLCFEHVTMVPIQTKLVDPARLSKKELEWLNKYNEEVRVKLTEGVRGSGDTEALRWLERETRAVVVQ